MDDYDLGHFTPYANFNTDEEAVMTNTYTNMAAQDAYTNRYIWRSVGLLKFLKDQSSQLKSYEK